jgi:hypothetical protein
MLREMMRQLHLALVTVAAYGSAARHVVPNWRFQLITTVESGSSLPALLGNVTDLALRADGGVYIAEELPGRVTLYDSHGNYVRTMMRDGSGPGETINPEIAARGDTLICFTPGLHRLAWISPSGKVVRERLVAVDLDEQHITVIGNGSVFIPSIGNTTKGFDASAMLVSPTGDPALITWTHSFLEDLQQVWHGPNWVINRRGPFSPPGAATIDPEGRLVVGGSRRSEWYVIVGKDTVNRVRLPDVPVTIPKHTRDSAFAAWFAKLPRFPDLDKVVTKDRFPTILPPWVSLDIDPDGRWWIGRPGPDGRLASWDIAKDGHIIGHAAVPAELLGVRFKPTLVSFGRGKVAMVHQREDGTPYVRIYRIIEQ